MFDSNAPKYLAVAVVVIGAIIDWRTRKLPNVLTGPAALLGLALNFYLGGVVQFLWALLGAVIGFAFIELPKLLTRKQYSEKQIGGGDSKLFAALGAILLPGCVLQVAFYFCLIYGVFGMVAIVRRRRNQSTDSAKPSTLALGPLIAAGTILAILLEKQTKQFFGF